MRNSFKVVFLAIALACAGNVSAQKKPIKKPVPLKVKRPVIPPPPREVRIETPPTSNDNGIYPTISISSEDQKYENEKICKTCDTLILEAGKSHIVVYDVKWMSNRETRTYREQPKESDLSQDYFALKNLNKREWDELRTNFPEKEVAYHHVYRNTFIKIPNGAQENLNLLDRQDRHEGFVYWSGKPGDKILHEKKMALLTEKVAKLRGSAKISSYYATFKQDSLKVENLMKTTSMDENVKANLNTFLLSEILDEYVFPIQFLELKNVKTVTLKVNPEKKLAFSFDKNRRLLGFNDFSHEKIDIVYQNDVPVKILEKDRPEKVLAFQGNTVSIKDNYEIKSYELVGKLFFKTNQMYVGKENYDNLDLLGSGIYKIKSSQGKYCEFMNRRDDGNEYSTCYSNNKWELPLTITETYPNGESTRTIAMAGDELVIENSNPYKTTKMTYKLDNKVLKSMQYSQKRANSETEAMPAISVEYEYFK